ncbi:MAG: hypothetical protein ACK5RI_03020 [Bacteroidota bacterium]
MISLILFHAAGSSYAQAVRKTLRRKKPRSLRHWRKTRGGSMPKTKDETKDETKHQRLIRSLANGF